MTTAVVIAWIYSYRPYKNPEKLFVELVSEASLMLIIMILPIFEFVKDENTREFFGWVVNAIVISTNVFLVSYLIFFHVKRICRQSRVKKWKKRMLRKMNLE